MKVLFLSQGKTISDHPGWNDALVKLKEEGFVNDFLNIPYFGFVEDNSWSAFYDHIYNICIRESFDLVYFHYFHKKGVPSPKECILKIKALKHKPVVITSSGDGFSDTLLSPRYPLAFKEASKYSDITFSTQMGKAVRLMKKWGAKNIVYSPNSLCQVRFKSLTIDVKNHEFLHDVVFVGSNNSSRNPFSRNYYAARKRRKLVTALYKKFGDKFGLYGNGWDLPCAKGPVPFERQQEVFQRGRIVVGGNPYSYSDYYSSNRVFFEIASGIPTVELYVPRLENVLKDNNYCYFAHTIPDLVKKCEDLLSKDQEKLYLKSNKAAKFISEKHTQYHRMKFKIDTVKRFINNNYKLDVKFPFFVDGIDLKEETKYAIKQ